MLRKRFNGRSIFLVIVFSSLNGQSIIPSVSNTLRYGNGERGTAGLTQKFSYFENLTDVRLSFQQSLTLGFRLLADDPPEVGDSFQGIKRRFIEFRQDEFLLRAGNLNELFGQGLALNLFENRGFAYDTWMDGVKAGYHSKFFNVTILGGTIDFRDSVIVARYEKYKLRGANLELTPVKGVAIGSSFIEANGIIPQFVTQKNVHAEIPELYGAYRSKQFQAFLGYVHKWVNVFEDKSSSTGDAVYASLSYSGKGFGVVMDYKDYRFDIRDPFDRLDNARATRMLPFQNPPIVQKEHTYTLLTRALHQVDFNDEVGIQMEGFYSFSSETMLNVNASIASRHDYYDYNQTAFSFSRRVRENNFLPSLEDKLSPYWEVFTELEHYFESSSAIRLGIARRENLLFNDFTGAAFSHRQQATTVPVQFQYALTKEYSLIVQTENEFAYDSYNTLSERYYTQLLTLIFTRSPDVSLSLRYEYTTNKADPTGKQDWIIAEAGYTFGQAHTATISFGRERGGQVCSNGVCQYQLPFEGVRISLRSSI